MYKSGNIDTCNTMFLFLPDPILSRTLVDRDFDIFHVLRTVHIPFYSEDILKDLKSTFVIELPISAIN